eukprot:Seg1377.3 transcript_id=Seg1377.3/GoldUCD/mRNA.D3Y31 product="hypothetical protein" protein_id=Seg1377.3/GoldUCD/D3Y31
MSSQLKKLRQKPEILKEYDAIIKEQLDKGIIERVTEMEQPSRVHYLPNQAVVREEAETTKVCVVYDASCKDGKKGTSLNDCLHVGPSLTPLLFDILVRFRENCVPLVGDIEKAFLNIEIDPADRDVLRFLWPENIQDPNSEIAVYRFQRAVFGVNASPFLLNAVLRYHIDQYRETDPEFCDKLSADFYVDDLCTGARNVEDAFKLYLRAKERMKEGGFRLRKWKTSVADLAQKIECEEGTENKTAVSVERAEESYAKASLGTSDSQKATKILGITWNNVQDNLEFDLGKWASGSDEKTITKRFILRQIARLFDPLGLASPITVQAKALFQELCIEKLDWDDELPDGKKEQWHRWVSDLEVVDKITIPRCLYEGNNAEIKSCYLHGFGDAGKKAYYAMIYLVYETSDGYHSRLICSKTRVAPLKDLSIPRLELMSARILATLMDTVRNALNSQVKMDGVKYWHCIGYTIMGNGDNLCNTE